MHKTFFTLAFAAGLLALPALSPTAAAQQPGHAGHHAAPPAQTQEQSAPAPDGMRHGGMRQMPHAGPQGIGGGMGMMMNCPMMQAGMQSMSGMGGQGVGGPTGDQSVASLALQAVNDKMHRDMAIAFTGNADVDFVRGMIAHHQGAIDMAKVVRAFGADAEIRELAEAIIEAQEEEIAMMRDWLTRNAPQ